MRADLATLYHIRIIPKYVKTHSSVYFHVVNGLTDAGGGVEKTLQEQPLEVRDALKIIYTTREFPSLPVAANPRVPESDREKVRKALLRLEQDARGQEDAFSSSDATDGANFAWGLCTDARVGVGIFLD